MFAIPQSVSLAAPADINASARGVVRVVILQQISNDRFLIVSHGTGFAVSGNQFVTNAHVVWDAVRDRRLRVGIVPPEGDERTFARIVKVDRARDLALIEVPEGLTLPALTFAADAPAEKDDVTAVGYPGVIDDTIGLRLSEPQIPTKGIGKVLQLREVKGIATVMHEATIARGNSGGPLLDECGRVIGVNSFGTLSAASEGEFFFAIANEETLSFLRRNNVNPKVSSIVCRSLAEIQAEEDAKERAEVEAQEAEQEAFEEAEAAKRDRIEAQITEERENMMALAAVLLVVAAGGGALAYQASGTEGGKNRAIAFGAIGGLAALGAVFSWITRPSVDDVEDRLLAESESDWGDDEGISGLQPGTFTCTLDTDRSRVTTAPRPVEEFEWRAEGCRGESQYQSVDGVWRRVFVPQEDYMVRVATIDLAKGEFRNERYLLPKTEWQKARNARMSYQPPSCGAENASQRLSDMQEGVLAMLPDQPNEKLIYTCESN